MTRLVVTGYNTAGSPGAVDWASPMSAPELSRSSTKTEPPCNASATIASVWLSSRSNVYVSTSPG